MKRNIAIFFQAVIVCVGLAALTFMLWEPHLEGRNVNATAFEVYFKDPFLAYVYLSSIPFFVALYQTFKALAFAKEGRTYSQATINAVRIIQRCAFITAGLVAGAVAYIFLTMRGKDDIAGGVAMGLLMICVSVVSAVAAGVVKNRLLARSSRVQ